MGNAAAGYRETKIRMPWRISVQTREGISNMDDKQKSKKYFDGHSSTFVNRNGYWNHDYRLTSRMVTPFSFVSVGRKTEEKPAMIKLVGLSDEQVSEISRRVADAFFDYEYNKEDIGLLKFISSRDDMFTYMDAIVRAAYKSGVLYTTSDRQEGYLMLSGEGAGGAIGFLDGMKMVAAEKRALGGFGNMKKFISACFCDGGTIETRMQKAKRKFLRIEMLVVRKEFQGQGFMRKMMEFTYRLADKKQVPVILDTDDKDKAARYEHLGMKLDRVRSCGERFHMYDLIRE